MPDDLFNRAVLTQIAELTRNRYGVTCSVSDNTNTPSIGEEIVPSGLNKAMQQTQSMRDWAKLQRQKGQFQGLGVGFNIRKSRGGVYMLNVSFGAQNIDIECVDDFELLEKIQEVIEEAFG